MDKEKLYLAIIKSKKAGKLNMSAVIILRELGEELLKVLPPMKNDEDKKRCCKLWYL
jgi:hypothetical protein